MSELIQWAKRHLPHSVAVCNKGSIQVMNVSLLNAWCSVKHSTNKSTINIKTNTTGISSIGFIKTHKLNVSKLAELSLFRHSFKKGGERVIMYSLGHYTSYN